jgi:hypothetical protein
MTTPTVIVLDLNEPKKHSIRFDAKEVPGDPKPLAISSIYISKAVPGILGAKQVKITIEPIA